MSVDVTGRRPQESTPPDDQQFYGDLETSLRFTVSRRREGNHQETSGVQSKMRPSENEEIGPAGEPSCMLVYIHSPMSVYQAKT